MQESVGDHQGRTEKMRKQKLYVHRIPRDHLREWESTVRGLEGHIKQIQFDKLQFAEQGQGYPKIWEELLGGRGSHQEAMHCHELVQQYPGYR